LTVLNLYWNDISDDGAKYFADALKQNTVIFCCLFLFCLYLFFIQKLTTLYLSNNRIGDDGAQELAVALQQNQVK
jgi:hypothetical protein